MLFRQLKYFSETWNWFFQKANLFFLIINQKKSFILILNNFFKEILEGSRSPRKKCFSDNWNIFQKLEIDFFKKPTYFFWLLIKKNHLFWFWITFLKKFWRVVGPPEKSAFQTIEIFFRNLKLIFSKSQLIFFDY